MISSYTQDYMLRLKSLMANQYSILSKDQHDPSVHRGLRNADGTGVLIGVTNIGSVQGYYMQEGERMPMPGKLYYRGISLEDIVESHRRNNSFGFSEVVFLLLTGKLSSREVLPLVLDTFRFIRDFKGEVPGASAKDCGNYLDMNLPMANYWGARYVRVLETASDDRLVYPE